MSLFSRLFGGGSTDAPETEPETHKDFRIFPEPIREGGNYRIAARIEREIGGETRIHQMIRADTVDDADTAREVTLTKARQLIDEQGDTIFE